MKYAPGRPNFPPVFLFTCYACRHHPDVWHTVELNLLVSPASSRQDRPLLGLHVVERDDATAPPGGLADAGEASEVDDDALERPRDQMPQSDDGSLGCEE